MGVDHLKAKFNKVTQAKKMPKGIPTGWKTGKGETRGWLTPVNELSWNERMIEICVDGLLDKALKLVLEKHFFKFGEKKFKQKAGPPMGVKLSPLFCGVFMNQWEEELRKLGIPEITFKFWKRYVDDVFSVWTKSKLEFEEFLKKMNQIHENIKFEADYAENNQPLNVLDISLTLEKHPTIMNRLSIKYVHYRKPTAANNVQLWSSAVDENQKIVIVSSMVRTILEHSKYKEDAEDPIQELNGRLREKNWPYWAREKAIKLGRSRFEGILKQVTDGKRSLHRSHEERESLALTNPKKMRPPTFFLQNFNNKELLKEFRKIAKKLRKIDIDWRIVEKSGPKLIHELETVDFLPDKCTHKKCSVCTSTIFEGQKQLPNCKSSNVVYMIRCNCDGCGITYIGETDRPLAKRFAEHQTKLKQEEIELAFKPITFKNNQEDNSQQKPEYKHAPSAVAAHCMQEHDGKFDLSIKILQVCEDEITRKTYENRAVATFQPGINRRIEGGGTVSVTSF